MGGTAYQATQGSVSARRVNAYAEEMANGNWRWLPPDARNPIVVDQAGNIMSGHHRFVAARQAGVIVPDAAITRFPRITARPARRWGSVTVVD